MLCGVYLGTHSHPLSFQALTHPAPHPATTTKVVAVTPPVDDWIQAVQGFGVPEPMAKDLGNM